MFHKGDYKSINDGLVSIDWDVEFESKSVETNMDFLGSKLEALVEEHIPMSTPKDYNAPWMNQSLVKTWKNKYKAWNRYSQHKSFERQQAYRNRAKLFKKRARQAKRLYEKRLAKGVRHNKRAFFRYVNSKLTVRPEITEIQNENGKLIDTDEGITNLMVNYFNTVTLQLAMRKCQK